MIDIRSTKDTEDHSVPKNGRFQVDTLMIKTEFSSVCLPLILIHGLPQI